jgi:hypothetical protein
MHAAGIDYRYADGQFRMLPRVVTVPNQNNPSSSEIKGNAGVRRWKLHLYLNQLGVRNLLAVYVSQKMSEEQFLYGLAFDNFKPTRKRRNFKCISLLKGSVGGEREGR